MNIDPILRRIKGTNIKLELSYPKHEFTHNQTVYIRFSFTDQTGVNHDMWKSLSEPMRDDFGLLDYYCDEFFKQLRDNNVKL